MENIYKLCKSRHKCQNWPLFTIWESLYQSQSSLKDVKLFYVALMAELYFEVAI